MGTLKILNLKQSIAIIGVPTGRACHAQACEI